MIKLSKVLPIAALGIALTAGINNRAEAYAYAYSDLLVTNGVVTITGGGISVEPEATSAASASLGGSGTATSHPDDALVAVGTGSAFPDSTTPSNNSWALEGSSAGHKYSWADSQIISEQTSAGGTISTRQIAEGNTTDDTLGVSSSSTSSSTELFFTLAGTGSVKFNFDAALAMAARIVAPHTGFLALASAGIEISIRNTVGSVLVFNWTAGSPTGFNVTSATNAYTLTSSLTTVTAGAQAFADSGSFEVISGLIGPGTYKLSLVAFTEERVRAHAIPAPGILTLFGLGLVMLGFMQRRNKVTTKLAA